MAWHITTAASGVAATSILPVEVFTKSAPASIDAIYAAAYEARDFRAMQMLDWFIKEQGEEEKNAADLITKMELFGGDSKGLYMLNSELKARVYTAPSLVL